MTAINKNFIVKNGLQVGNDFLLADDVTGHVGIASSVPKDTLSVSGQISADNLTVSGVSTLTELKGSQLSYTNVGTDNLYAVAGVVTSLTGSNIDVSGELKSTRLAIGVAGTSFSVTSDGVGVGTTIPTKRFEVAGDANITGALSALVVNSDVNSTGVSTFLDLDATYLETTDFNVLGISTLGFAGATRLSVSGNTTLGITTTGPLDVSQINVTGVTTIGAVNISQLGVTGVSTFTGLIDANDGIDVTGATELDAVNISGVTTVAGLIDGNGGVDITGATELDNVNVSGITTVAGLIDANGGIDVTGATELDAVNISGVTTVAGLIDGNAGANISGAETILSSATVSDLTNTRVVIAGTSGALQDNANLTFTGSNLVIGSGAGLDVDGHTELDNVNISGITTVAGLIDGNAGANISGAETILSSATVSDLTNTRVVLAGTSGALQDNANLTFTGSNLVIGSGAGLDVDGHTELDNVNISGVSTLTVTTATSLGVTNVNVTGILTASNINPTQINVSGMSTFNNVYASGSVGVKSTSPSEALDVVGNLKVIGTVISDGFSGPGIVTSIIDGAGSDAVEVTPGVYRIDLYGSAVGEAWGTVVNGLGEIGVRTDVLVGMGTTVPPEYTLDVYAKYEEEAARFLCQGTNVYAPFIVNSNVQVTNLNAQYVGGKTAPSGSIVGTTDSQTLTNKTLTTPTIQGTGAFYSGSTSGTVTLKATAVAGSNTVTLPATTGTVITSGDSGTVTSTMIANGTIVNDDLSVSAAIAYSKLALTGSILNADINASAAIAISKLAASTISGVSLGNNLSNLSIGAYLTQNGQTYNGSTTKTVAVDADTANTASKVVARDGSGNFSAGTITATLSGTATNATNINVADESSDTTCFPVFTTAATGNQAPKTDSSALTYNASAGQLDASAFYAAGNSVFGHLTGTKPLLEDVNVVAGTVNGTTNIDVKTSNVWMFTTNASANWTHNIRGDSGTSLNSTMAIGDSIVVTILAKKSSTTHYATDITIDSAAQTELWLGGSAPTAGLSGSNYDMYTWTIVKTASATFTVFASQSQYGA